MPNSMLPQQHVWKVTITDIEGKTKRHYILCATYTDAHRWANKRAATNHGDIVAVALLGPLSEDT